MFGMSLQKRLRFESLEKKIAPANLSVALVNGDLLITGDSGDNAFVISSGNEFQGYQFNIVLNGQLGDTINGEVPDGPIEINGVTRDIIINLGDGNDEAILLGEIAPDNSRDFTVPRNLTINGGAGDDVIGVGVSNLNIVFSEFPFQNPVHVVGNLTVNGGGGNDAIYASGVRADNDFTITDTQGDNLVQFFPTFLFNTYPVISRSSEVFGDLSVTTGSGIDAMEISDIIAHNDISVNSGAGDDLVQVAFNSVEGNLAVNLGAGSNTALVAEMTVAGGVALGGAGTNNITIDNASIGTALVVLTGSGSDTIQISNTTSSSALIATLGGQDNVQIIDSAFDLLIVELGAGNDTLGLSGVDAILALFSGGGGTDTFEDFGDNDFQLARIRLAFEQFPEL